jgi:hypothetical protein
MRREQNREAVICLIAGLAAMQPANGSVIKQVNNHFDVGLGMEHLSYHEINPASGPVHRNEIPTGADLDGETGTLFSPSLSFGLQRKLWIIDNMRVETRLHMAFGDATYNGHLQDRNGNIVAPATDRSGETFTDLEVRVGKGISLFGSERDLLTPHIAYGLNEWHRKVGENNPSSGGGEQYRNRYWTAGIQYQFAVNDRLVLSADWNYGRTLSPRMNASDLYGTFDLGSTPLHDYEADATYTISRSAFIGLRSWWMRYGYNQSQLVIDYNQGLAAYEPGSKTNRYGLQTVFGYSF